MALLVRSGLGMDPWSVLHEGLATRSPLSFGLVTIATGALVLLAWWPLRQRPGLGTVSNVIVVGLAIDATLALLPAPGDLGWRVAYLLVGVLGNGVAGGMYLGAGLGPGPRDGLMTGLVARTGGSVRVIRGGLELTVLGAGWLLGGTVGVGTVVYALAIGPIVQTSLGWFDVDATTPRAGRRRRGRQFPSRSASQVSASANDSAAVQSRTVVGEESARGYEPRKRVWGLSRRRPLSASATRGSRT